MKYTSEYEEYSAKWIFEYQVSSDTAFVTPPYVSPSPVIEGKSLRFQVGEHCGAWLQTSWQEATEASPRKGLYCGRNTEFIRGPKNCRLSNDFCPLCLKQKDAFSPHHCIWTMEGGTDDYENLLQVCRTCHAILSFGNVEDAEPKDKAAYYHQLMYFGLDFFPRHNATRKGHENRNYYTFWPHAEYIKNCIDNSDAELQKQASDMLKQDARLKYQYFRDLGLGIWSWQEFEEYRNGL